MPFSTVTETRRRGSSGPTFVAAGFFTTAGFAAAARASFWAWWRTGFASSAIATISSPTSSSIAIPVATTAIVRHGCEWPLGPDG